MSEHSHAPDAHDHGSHSDAAHGSGVVWGEYNMRPLAPSTLPPVSQLSLVTFGVTLAVLLCMIFIASLQLASRQQQHVDLEVFDPLAGHSTSEHH